MPQVDSCRCILNEYLAIDSGGNVIDLVIARTCCTARMLPREAKLVSELTGLPGGGQKVYRALSGPMDWILRCIKTTTNNVRYLPRRWSKNCQH